MIKVALYLRARFVTRCEQHQSVAATRYKEPFDEGIPGWRGSMAMASRKARAVALKIPSAM